MGYKRIFANTSKRIKLDSISPKVSKVVAKKQNVGSMIEKEETLKPIKMFERKKKAYHD